MWVLHCLGWTPPSHKVLLHKVHLVQAWGVSAHWSHLWSEKDSISSWKTHAYCFHSTLWKSNVPTHWWMNCLMLHQTRRKYRLQGWFSYCTGHQGIQRWGQPACNTRWRLEIQEGAKTILVKLFSSYALLTFQTNSGYFLKQRLKAGWVHRTSGSADI